MNLESKQHMKYDVHCLSSSLISPYNYHHLHVLDLICQAFHEIIRY